MEDAAFPPPAPPTPLQRCSQKGRLPGQRQARTWERSARNRNRHTGGLKHEVRIAWRQASSRIHLLPDKQLSESRHSPARSPTAETVMVALTPWASGAVSSTSPRAPEYAQG